MATPVPYRWITGLPAQAQKEIERDFLHLQGQITGGASLFDAIIDPGLSASNATAHQYKNITDFTVGESLSATRSFYVGIVGRPGTPVVETSDITFNGPVTFVGAGPSTNAAIFAPGNRPVIDFNGHHVTNSKWVCWIGLELSNTSTAVGTLFSGPVCFDNCELNCTNSGLSQKITTVSAGTVIAVKTGFYGAGAIGSNVVWCMDCMWQWPIAGGAIGPSSGVFVWDGGTFDCGGSTPSLSLGGSANVYVRSFFNSNLSGSTSGTRTGVSITTTATCFVDIETVGNPPDLTVGAGAGDVTVRGFFEQVTVSGNTGNHARKIDVVHSNGTMDVTGPCEITANLASTGSSPNTIFRGDGVTARLTLDRATSNPFISLVACTDSLIVASFTAPSGAGAQAYTIDSSSARCVLVLSGVSHTNFSVASTNAGTNCNVITELGASGGTWGSGGTGTPGANGAPGMDGYDGDEGFPGSPGSQGLTGAQGRDGTPGAPGYDGEDGAEGYPGNPGPTGAAGVAGAAGQPGTPGAPGYDGTDGEDGSMYGAQSSWLPNVQRFTASGSWIKPPGATFVKVMIWAGGGGGGSGGSTTGAVTRSGGCGGGGGAYYEETFLASDLASSETVTIGTGGNGGTTNGSGSAGNDGGQGNDSVFGVVERIRVGGGGGGRRGGIVAAAGAGGGGGGVGDSLSAPGSVGVATASQGGGPIGGIGANTQQCSVGSCGGQGSIGDGSNTMSSELGGGGGGGHSAAATPVSNGGGASYRGGGGGGVGGCSSATPGVTAPTNGGGVATIATGSTGWTGGGAGTSGASPTGGTDGPDGTANRGGAGGGGGGSTVTANTSGAKGGNGGARGGGGGGGGSGSNTGGGGAGGNGGRGECVIVSW